MANPHPSHKFQPGHAVRQKPGPPGIRLDFGKDFSRTIRDKLGFELGRPATEQEVKGRLREVIADWLLD